jgi:hypothetical protein
MKFDQESRCCYKAEVCFHFPRTSATGGWSWGRFHQHFTSSFCMRRSQKCKKTDNLIVFFPLYGSFRLKAVRKTLMKLTPSGDVELLAGVVNRRNVDLGGLVLQRWIRVELWTVLQTT